MNEPPGYYYTDRLVDQLGLPRNITEANLTYLRDKGLIKEAVPTANRPIGPFILITAYGVDVVEHPEWFEGKLALNLQAFSFDRVSGQVAIGQNITQIQVKDFEEIKKLAEQHSELDEETRQNIRKKLGELEQELGKGPLSKSKIDEFKEFFGRFAWLWQVVAPLITEYLKKYLGL